MEIFVVYLGYTEKRYFFPLFLRKEESLLVHLPHLDPLQYRVKSIWSVDTVPSIIEGKICDQMDKKTQIF